MWNGHAATAQAWSRPKKNDADNASCPRRGTWTKYLHPDVKRVGTGAGAQTFWHHRDHLKTIRVITDAAGNPVQRATFKPYGDRTLSTAHKEEKGFIGERHDRPRQRQRGRGQV